MRELVLDISKYDDGIDLAAWKTHRGLWGVVIKLGGHEDAVGGQYEDGVAERHYQAAKAAGLHIGFYYYTDVRDTASAKLDAKHFSKLIGDKEYDLPCYMDAEDGRQMNIGKDKLTQVIKAFCDTLIECGHYAGIYTFGSSWLEKMNRSELTNYANWIAWWRQSWPSEAGDIGLWQQGGMNYDGHVVYDDIPGYHDCNWCVVDYPSRIKAGKKIVDDAVEDIAVSSNTSLKVDISKKEFSGGRASDVINAAYGELGYYAPDDPEPGSKYGRWLAKVTGEDWLAGPSNEIFWCCMFASWCLDQGGVKMDGFPTQNTDLALNGGARKYAVDKHDVRYGDIVIFNWDWNSTTDHIGFATGEFDGAGFTTIEGNVGNAVKEKYRQMGNVAYVLRPPYNGYGVVGSNTPTVSTDPKNNRDGGKLDVDGIGGWNTVTDLQHILGTTEDGHISGQYPSNNQYHWGMSNTDYDHGGSEIVQAIQKKIGAELDGQWGPETSRKLQELLVNWGYKIDVDGHFGSESVKALQQSINEGRWANV